MPSNKVTRQRPQSEHRVTIAIVGDAVDVLDALCGLQGRRAPELLQEWVVAELQRAGTAPEVARQVRRARRRRTQAAPLRAV